MYISYSSDQAYTNMDSQKPKRKPPPSRTRKRTSKSRALKKRHQQANIFNKNAEMVIDSSATVSFPLRAGELTIGEVDSDTSGELTVLQPSATYSRRVVSENTSLQSNIIASAMEGCIEAQPSTSTEMDYTFITKNEYDRQDTKIEIIMNWVGVRFVFGATAGVDFLTMLNSERLLVTKTEIIMNWVGVRFAIGATAGVDFLTMFNSERLLVGFIWNRHLKELILDTKTEIIMNWVGVHFVIGATPGVDFLTMLNSERLLNVMGFVPHNQHEYLQSNDIFQDTKIEIIMNWVGVRFVIGATPGVDFLTMLNSELLLDTKIRIIMNWIGVRVVFAATVGVDFCVHKWNVLWNGQLNVPIMNPIWCTDTFLPQMLYFNVYSGSNSRDFEEITKSELRQVVFALAT
ncbi:hypothetical protein FQR65_LT11069 [Abscondita terminalis]|nr:hypothetical protein FQR65_LT11069 [Abscondita terminalis]